MHSLHCAAAVTALVAFASAQDFIHYKFDSPCTTEVINQATGPSALAANGVLEISAGSTPWTTGMFGGSLAGAATGYNRIRTGWDPSTQNVTGDLTMAWFMRLHAGAASPGTTLVYLMGAPSGGFRMFTGGVGGNGLYQRVLLATGGNGVNASIANDFYLPATAADVQALAAVGWVHIAIVIDTATTSATWYVNGTAVLSLPAVTGGALVTAAGPFTLGYYSSASRYDTDEFLMSFRAYTAAEILALSQAPQAGDGDYLSGIATQCGTLGLSSAGGRPYLGNAAYSLTVNTTANGLYVLMSGFDRCLYAGAFPLPLDAGLLSPIAAGCSLLTDIVTTSSGIATGAPATVPFGIPNNNALSGINVSSQAALIDLLSSAVSASNGFMSSVGS